MLSPPFVCGFTDLLFLPFPAFHFNFLFSLFTTVSADNKHRQLRGIESYLLMADHPIIFRKSEVDKWTKNEEPSLLSEGLVISSPVLSCPQNLTAKPQGCDPQGGEAFAPGAPGSLGIFKGPV